MDNTSLEALLVHPLLLPVPELILSIGEVVIDFVTPDNFKKVKQEDINNHLREDDDARERQIIGQFSLSNRIALRDLCLISKEDDMSKDEGHQDHSLSIASIGTDTTEKGLHTLSLLQDVCVSSTLIFAVIVILSEINQLKLHVKLSLKDASEYVLNQLKPLAQPDHSLLHLQLYLLNDRPDVCSHHESYANLSEVREDERLEIISTHSHDEFKGCKHCCHWCRHECLSHDNSCYQLVDEDVQDRKEYLEHDNVLTESVSVGELDLKHEENSNEEAVDKEMSTFPCQCF